MKKILVAIDFSDSTDAVLSQALKFAEAFESSLCVLHAQPDGQIYAREDDNKDYLEELYHKIDLVRKTFQERQIFPYFKEATGDAAECILNESERFQPNLIIIGTHRRNALSRLFSKHTREELIKKANCSLLLVHPEDNCASSIKWI